jgi:hypothetical protein
VPVAVCGTSVPGVWDVLDVVPEDELVVVAGEDVAVVEEFEGEVLLEQAPRASVQAGRTSRPIDQVRSALGIAECTTGPTGNGGSAGRLCRQERVGTVPITDARSMERR